VKNLTVQPTSFCVTTPTFARKRTIDQPEKQLSIAVFARTSECISPTPFAPSAIAIISFSGAVSFSVIPERWHKRLRRAILSRRRFRHIHRSFRRVAPLVSVAIVFV